MIDENGEIVVLDIDGCQFADIEREHAYLRLRFPQYEMAFRYPNLDLDRMTFYGLCLHISAAYGHYRLLVQGYPGSEMLRQIFEWNASQVVRQVSG